MRLSIIVAMDDNQLIGSNNALPWHLPADLSYFKKMTTGKTVLMGRKTHQSIGKALPNRRNVVITTNRGFKVVGCEVVFNIHQALNIAKNEAEVMVMGGASLYQQMLPLAERLYITRVEGAFIGDAYFPVFNRGDWHNLSKKTCYPNEKNHYTYHFEVWGRN